MKLSFLKLFKLSSWIILVLFAVFQIAYWADAANTFAIFIILITWVLTTEILLTEKILYPYSLSFFLLFGYCFSQYYLPLLVTTFEGKPVIYNLKYPFLLFLHSISVVVILFATHSIYRYFNVKNTKNTFKNILVKSDFFVVPSDTQIWIIGCIGTISLFISSSKVSAIGVDSEQSVGFNFLNGFTNFAYVPYYVLFSDKIFNKKILEENKDQKKTIYIVLYSILIFAISIVRNSRGAFMYGLAGVGFTYLLALFLNLLPIPKISIKLVAIGCFFLYMLNGPLQDLGIAMLINRGDRNQLSKESLLTSTWESFNDKAAIADYQKLLGDMGKDNTTGWNESYVDNLFLARFCNLKLNDLSLEQSIIVGSNNKQMYEYSIDKLWAILPLPVIDFFNIKIDKQYVISSSFGDVLYFQSGAGINAIGGLRSGHFMGTGYAAFGWWYLVLLSLAIIPCYYLIDSFCNNILKQNSDGSRTWQFNISLAGWLGLIFLFTFIVQESVISFFQYIVRGWIQNAFVYYLIYQVSRFIARQFFNKQHTLNSEI